MPKDYSWKEYVLQRLYFISKGTAKITTIIATLKHLKYHHCPQL